MWGMSHASEDSCLELPSVDRPAYAALGVLKMHTTLETMQIQGTSVLHQKCIPTLFHFAKPGLRPSPQTR